MTCAYDPKRPFWKYSWYSRGSTIPICQFGLSLLIFEPVSTLSILTVFYIYVDECRCNRPRWWSCCSGWGWWWWRAMCIVVWSWYILSMICIWTCMRMLYDSWDNMCIFDMVVYMGMYPNACMIDDVLGVLWPVLVVCYCCIVIYCYRCKTYNFGAD